VTAHPETDTSNHATTDPKIADRWAAAMPIEAYVAQLWRKHRGRFARNLERTVVPSDLRARFGGRPLRLLVLTDPWCEDSAHLAPVVWRLAQEVEGVELRVLRASEHRDLAGRYLTARGHPAIPVFVALGADLRELGALVERPARATAEMAAETRRFQQEHADLAGIRRTVERMPEETRAMVQQHIAAWRDGQHDRWARYLLEDLAAIAERDDRRPVA
jgi:Thioredoxin